MVAARVLDKLRRLLGEPWIRDLGALAVVSVIVLVLFVHIDASEAIHAWSRAYERFEVDEVLALLMLLSLGFCLFAIRRILELKRELGHHHRLARDQLETKADELSELARRCIVEREKVEAISRAKSEFLANLTHKLRTPLNAVLGFSQVICSETLGPIGNQRYLEYATDIKASGEHLLTLMNDIIDLWEIEAGKLELDEKLVDVEDLLDDCVRLISGEARDAEVEIEAELPAELPTLYADEERLRQIFVNLLTNAIKFTPTGGRIEIVGGLGASGGLDVTFRDTGVGMAQEDICAVISPWDLVNRTSSKYDKGAGLGLPLTKALVELHGGQLRIESAVGSGTAATVSFPPECVVSRIGSVA